MKILYLSKAILPSEISNSLSIMRMCQAFVDSGHEVLLTGVAPSKSAPEPIKYYGLSGGFEVVRNTLNGLMKKRLTQRLQLSGLTLAWKTRQLPMSFKPDLVYSRLTLAELALVPRNMPIFYEMHSLGHLGKSFFQRLLFRLLASWKIFRRIIVTTDTLAGMLKNELPGVEVLVARLSAEPPVSIDRNKLDAFRKNQLQGHGFKHHVGYTGYLDTLGLRGTKIICKTATQMPDTAFHIVGGASDIVAHWKKYASNYKHHDNIFFYGYRNPVEMPLFLNCFNVVLSPLQFRPSNCAPAGKGMSPLKIPQYMAYAKAIVASDIPAHREILKHNETALLVPADDVSEWVEAIKSFLENPEKRAEMGQKARQHYKSEFTPQIRVKRILDSI
jgi:glycosyltransferase involved in cell wall biosynthesis